MVMCFGMDGATVVLQMCAHWQQPVTHQNNAIHGGESTGHCLARLVNAPSRETHLHSISPPPPPPPLSHHYPFLTPPTPLRPIHLLQLFERETGQFLARIIYITA